MRLLRKLGNIHRVRCLLFVTCCSLFLLLSSSNGKCKKNERPTKKIQQNTEHSLQNRPKIIKNRALGWPRRPLGEVLEAFWPPGPPRRAKGRQTLVRWPTLGPPRPPLWDPVFDIFRHIGCFSESVFRSSVLEASGLYFSWIWGVFWCDCLMFFCCVSGASITKENVVLIQYLLGSKHIYLFEKRRKSSEIRHIFKNTSGSGLGSGLWKDLGSIWGAFWHP